MCVYYTYVFVMYACMYSVCMRAGIYVHSTYVHASMNQGVQGNAKQRQPGQHLFQRKKELPWVGLEPTTLCFLDRVLFLLTAQQAGL